MKNEKGITLIALVITIIILLILATVSISLMINNGIIDRATSGVNKYSNEEVLEQIKLAYAEYQMAQFTNDAESATLFIKNRLKSTFNLEDNEIDVDVDDGIITVLIKVNGTDKEYTYNATTGVGSNVKTVAEYPDATPGIATTQNSKYTSDGKTAVIPAGYAISSVATEQSIDYGLVIKEVVDNNNDGIEDDEEAERNEWVWIPVDSTEFGLMFYKNEEGWLIYQTDVITKYMSLDRGTLTDPKNGGRRRRTPDTNQAREPGFLTMNAMDLNSTNLSAAGLVAGLTDPATILRDDYKNMVKSIKKNGGFYVGRYELSSLGTKKNAPPLTNTDWYHLYAACKSSSLGSGSVVPSMIWGCQWDSVCNFIKTSGDQKDIGISHSSFSYGNYTTYDEDGNIAHEGVKENTGSNEEWKANNIYDIAGNCWEWTQEAYSRNIRVRRGGSYMPTNAGGRVDWFPANAYNPHVKKAVPTYSADDQTSRPVLYIK